MYDSVLLENLKTLSNDKIEQIFEKFDIIVPHNGYSQEIRMACPIHDGDNRSGFLYDKNLMYWACWTNECHDYYGNRIFGLIRALLHKTTEIEPSFDECVEWLKKFHNITELNPLDKEKLQIEQFLRREKYFKTLKLDNSNGKFKPVPLKYILPKITPSIYFQDQFSKETIRKFHISDCHKTNKIMSNRAYCLILDDEGRNMVGVSGRIMSKPCSICEEYHNINKACPIDDQNTCSYPKWVHYGFSRRTTLYNLWNASKAILDTKIAIITEGPKDVWWLDQCGIKNGLAVMGLKVSYEHIKKLLRTEVNKIILCLDNDIRGNRAAIKNAQNLRDYFTTVDVSNKMPDGFDIADLSTEQVKIAFGEYYY